MDGNSRRILDLERIFQKKGPVVKGGREGERKRCVMGSRQSLLLQRV